MDIDEMRSGFRIGRILVQEATATLKEKHIVDELHEEGVCIASPWAYIRSAGLECRIIQGLMLVKDTVKQLN